MINRFFLKIEYLPLAFFILLYASSSLWLWRPDLSWHDQQRIAELGVFIACFASAPKLILKYFLSVQNSIVAAVFVLGLASAITASHPFWGIIEWTRFLALLALLLLFAQQPSLAKFVLALLCAAAVAHTFKFLVYYTAAISTGILNFHPDVITSGFSNRRFFAQFHTMAIPLTLYLTQQLYLLRKTIWASLLLALLALQWVIAIHLGGRGQLMGLAFAHGALFFFARHHWPLLRIQAYAALLGFFLYGVMFKLAPVILNLDASPTTLMRNSMSGRALLWEQAWHMALEHPWLGVGPMGFAAVINPVAAHPHQMILQWLAEWGFIATAGALLLISLGLWRGYSVVRRPGSTSLDATLWLVLISMLVLAQVDGVLVIPYTGVWLMAAGGMAMNRWATLRPAERNVRVISTSICIFAAAILTAVLVTEIPAVMNKGSKLPSHFIGWEPRFWINGWISESK